MSKTGTRFKQRLLDAMFQGDFDMAYVRHVKILLPGLVVNGIFPVLPLR